MCACEDSEASEASEDVEAIETSESGEDIETSKTIEADEEHKARVAYKAWLRRWHGGDTSGTGCRGADRSARLR
jgi:hypothetical protein